MNRLFLLVLLASGITQAQDMDASTSARTSTQISNFAGKVISGKRAEKYYNRLTVYVSGLGRGVTPSTSCPGVSFVRGRVSPIGLADKLTYVRHVQYSGGRCVTGCAIRFGEDVPVTCMKTVHADSVDYQCMMTYADRGSQSDFLKEPVVQNILSCLK